MFPKSILPLAALASVATAACSAATRLAGARQVVYAYNLADAGTSAAAFKQVPFGVPNEAGACLTTIIPDGACPIPVALTGTGAYDFALTSRQAFSRVTGDAFIDFPQNGTTLIETETLGIRNAVGLPASFIGHVYLDYNSDCRIHQIRAYAQIPSQVLGLAFDTAGLPSLPAPVCGILPI